MLALIQLTSQPHMKPEAHDQSWLMFDELAGETPYLAFLCAPNITLWDGPDGESKRKILVENLGTMAWLDLASGILKMAVLTGKDEVLGGVGGNHGKPIFGQTMTNVIPASP